MSEEDNELERLKAKRLAEMQKNVSFKEKQEIKESTEDKKDAPSPRDILVKNLGYRGLEVLQNAESQFPNETKIVVQKMAELFAKSQRRFLYGAAGSCCHRSVILRF